MKTKVIQELINPGKGDITAHRRVIFEEVPFENSVELLQLAEISDASEETETVEIPDKEDRERYDGNTAYILYLREIGQTPLLTPAQEISLAKRIQKGDAKAREEMIKANLRLVVKIAREYEDYGLPLLDLINEGNMGLMKAVERFDPNKGAKLSTYAAWWIKQSIRRALSNQSKTIRLPVHIGDKLLHMRRAAMKLQELLGREPTDEELAEEVGMTAFRVSELRTASIRPASLDAPIGEDESNRFGEIVQDERVSTPYAQLVEKTNTDMVKELVETLPDREATILRYRFGLDGDEEKTLEEVGEKFGVTRERIRQIQNIALKKLRRMIQKREAVKMAA
jgi:RNA polymerase primary sigma factor